MGLLDDYSQFGEETSKAEDLSNPTVLRRKRSEIERSIVIANSDLKKLLREKQELEIEQRKLRKEEERIRVDRGELDKKVKKIEDDQRLLEEEIYGLKKKLKTLPT